MHIEKINRRDNRIPSVCIFIDIETPLEEEIDFEDAARD